MSGKGQGERTGGPTEFKNTDTNGEQEAGKTSQTSQTNSTEVVSDSVSDSKSHNINVEQDKGNASQTNSTEVVSDSVSDSKSPNINVEQDKGNASQTNSTEVVSDSVSDSKSPNINVEQDKGNASQTNSTEVVSDSVSDSKSHNINVEQDKGNASQTNSTEVVSDSVSDSKSPNINVEQGKGNASQTNSTEVVSDSVSDSKSPNINVEQDKGNASQTNSTEVVSDSVSDSKSPNINVEQSKGNASQTNSSEVVSDSDAGRKETKNWIQVVQEFYKSDFAVFMAYTTLSAFAGGVFGAILTVYVPRYIGLDNGTVANQAQTTCPTDTVSLQEQIDKMNQDLDQCRSDRNTDQGNISKLKNDIGALNNNVGTLNTDLSTIRKETQTNYTLLTQDVTLRNFVVESQMSELTQVFVSKEWLFIILLMGLFEVALIGVVWVMWQKLTDNLRQKLRRRSGGHHVAEPAANGRVERGGIQGDRSVLDRVRSCELENRVCVTSFHSETVDKHRAQIKVILSQNEASKYATLPFLIGSHKDILQMPPAKLYMVFVDFNERNVILEDPNKGLGDLRLTTVQAIEKMGADAILTYSRDIGSNSLTPGDLYNPDLSSVKQHSELRRLESRKRMLSIFDKFNKTQVDHIVKVVKDVVK